MDCSTVIIMLNHIDAIRIRRFIFFSQNIHMFKYCGEGIFLIFPRNDFMYRICTLFGKDKIFLNDVMLNLVIFSETNHFTS